MEENNLTYFAEKALPLAKMSNNGLFLSRVLEGYFFNGKAHLL